MTNMLEKDEDGTHSGDYQINSGYMKSMLLILLGIVISTTISLAQSSTVAIRAGGSLILEEPTPGFVSAIDLKIPNSPFILSPFFQFYVKSGLTKQYYGANIQIAKQLSKGFYLGVGGGMAKWSFDGYSRTSPSISPLLGFRLKIANKISLFTEGKMFVNTKTNQDTNDWNNGQLINGPLFDNDITLSIGLGF